jgi:hypothetical protein
MIALRHANIKQFVDKMEISQNTPLQENNNETRHLRCVLVSF